MNATAYRHEPIARRSPIPLQLAPVPKPDGVMPEGWRYEQLDGCWKPVLIIEVEPS